MEQKITDSLLCQANGIDQDQYNQRMCEVRGVLGDEYHFLLVCKNLSDLGQRYIPKYYLKYPSMYKFIALISTDHVKTIRNLADFVYSSFQRITL